MLTGAQKRYLRSMSNRIKAAIQVGKEGLSGGFIGQLDRMLEDKELVKVSLLQSFPAKAKQTAPEAAELTGSEVVQVIGRKFVLYRKAKENPVIVLPE
ncbi:MAG: YhbY family RNA-binding protein [Elusimicrobia bacterium]|nr:YhbY family RNA-binding protein [Elusimicrobiota bacterium]